MLISYYYVINLRNNNNHYEQRSNTNIIKCQMSIKFGYLCIRFGENALWQKFDILSFDIVSSHVYIKKSIT